VKVGQSLSPDLSGGGCTISSADGTPPRKQTRTVIVSQNTTLRLIDYRKGGNSAEPIELSNIKSGDVVVITSTENIRDASKINATQLEVRRY